MKFDKIKTEIGEINNLIYIYSIDFLSFVKSLKKKSLDNKIINHSLKLSNDIYNLINKADESENLNEIIIILKQIIHPAEIILKNLQDFKCKDELLNEKSDLTIDSYKIIEKINNLIYLCNS